MHLEQSASSFNQTIISLSLTSSSSSSSSSTILPSTTTTIIKHFDPNHLNNQLIRNVNSEAIDDHSNEFIVNPIVLGCILLLFCLLIFMYSLLFLLSFRGFKNKSNDSSMAPMDVSIDTMNSKDCQSIFDMNSQSSNNFDCVSAPLNLSVLNDDNSTFNNTATTTSPCAITSLEDDQRQADEVEKQRELTLMMTTNRLTQQNAYSYTMENVPNALNASQNKAQNEPFRLLSPTMINQGFRSLDLNQQKRSLRKHQPLPSAVINEINDQKYHNSYSEVIEELKNRFEILAAAV